MSQEHAQFVQEVLCAGDRQAPLCPDAVLTPLAAEYRRLLGQAQTPPIRERYRRSWSCVMPARLKSVSIRRRPASPKSRASRPLSSNFRTFAVRAYHVVRRDETAGAVMPDQLARAADIGGDDGLAQRVYSITTWECLHPIREARRRRKRSPRYPRHRPASEDPDSRFRNRFEFA